MKRFCLSVFVCVLLLPICVNAQTVYQPQNAKATIQVLKDKVKVGKNGKALLQLTISPIEEFCIYSLKEKNGSPITIDLPELNGVKFGKPSESPNPKKIYDEGFEEYVFIHEKTTTLNIPVTVNSNIVKKKRIEIEVTIAFQSISYSKGMAVYDFVPVKFIIDLK